MELANHLGNVLATISDKKIGVSLASDSSLIDHYEADVQTAQDYYPFGMVMPGRMFVKLNIPGGSVEGTTQVNGYPLPVDLELSSRQIGGPSQYVASSVIDLTDGFTSEDNADVTAYIADTSYAGTGNGGSDGGNVAGAGKYRYGFNGKENDNEVKGYADQIDYGHRIYDPRTGRFLSLDPLQKKYPWFTPYQFAGNSPVGNIDLDGLENTNYNLIDLKNSNGTPTLGIQKTGTSETGFFQSIYNANTGTSGEGGETHTLYYHGEKLVTFSSFQDLKTIVHGKTVAEIKAVGANMQEEGVSRVLALHALAESMREPSTPTNYARNPVENQRLLNEAASEEELPSYIAEPFGSSSTTNEAAIVINNGQKLGGRTIIVDENLSPKIASQLKQNGYNVKVFPTGTLDPDIIKYADETNSIVLTNNIKDFKKQGITTMKVTENMKKGSEVENVVKYIENVNKSAETNPDLLKKGNNVNLSQHQQ